MAYSINLIDREFVEIVHTGATSVQEAEAARREAAAIMAENGIYLVLADISAARTHESILSLFQFNAGHAEQLPRGTRIATVISQTSISTDMVRFSETVASNRGVELKAFLDRSEALVWLRRKPS